MHQPLAWKQRVPALLPRLAFCAIILFGAFLCFSTAVQIHHAHALLWSVLALSFGLQLARALRERVWREIDDAHSMYALSNLLFIGQCLLRATPVPEIGLLAAACMAGLWLAPELSPSFRASASP